MQHSSPLLRSSTPPSPLPRSSAHAFLPAPFFSSSSFPSSLRPFESPFSRVPRRATLRSSAHPSPLPRSSAHSFLPASFFLLPPFLRPSAHSGPRFPAFPAVRHSTPLLHLHFPAPLLIRSSPPPFFLLPPFLRPSAHSGPRFPAFPAARHSHPQALAVIRQATGREADNRAAEAAGQKNPALTGRTLSGINLYSRKKGRLHLAHTNALTQHNQSGAYPLINPCSHN